MSNPWFRLHSDILNDEKVLSLAFSDRWFFVAVMALKSDGMIDKYEGDALDKKVAIRLGISRPEAIELRCRLADEMLIDANWQPCAWDKRQYTSDTSTDRVRAYRQKKKAQTKQQDADMKRPCNVSLSLLSLETLR